jgi:hypothetical protein
MNSEMVQMKMQYEEPNKNHLMAQVKMIFGILIDGYNN